MKTVGAYEARTHFSKLLDEVANGEAITITKNGVPVAMLMPPTEVLQRNYAAAVDRLRRWRDEQGLTLGGLSLREMIEEGRE